MRGNKFLLLVVLVINHWSGSAQVKVTSQEVNVSPELVNEAAFSSRKEMVGSSLSAQFRTTENQRYIFSSKTCEMRSTFDKGNHLQQFESYVDKRLYTADMPLEGDAVTISEEGHFVFVEAGHGATYSFTFYSPTLELKNTHAPDPNGSDEFDVATNGSFTLVTVKVEGPDNYLMTIHDKEGTILSSAILPYKSNLTLSNSWITDKKLLLLFSSRVDASVELVALDYNMKTEWSKSLPERLINNQVQFSNDVLLLDTPSNSQIVSFSDGSFKAHLYEKYGDQIIINSKIIGEKFIVTLLGQYKQGTYDYALSIAELSSGEEFFAKPGYSSTSRPAVFATSSGEFFIKHDENSFELFTLK